MLSVNVFLSSCAVFLSFIPVAFYTLCVCYQLAELYFTHRRMEVLGAQESSMSEMSPQRNNENRLPFQIFPDPVEVYLSPEGSPNHLQQFSPSEKERLPSIVVEPTDVSEVESGELRWPPEDMDFCSEEDEDLFLEQCIPPANIADWGEEEETSVLINHQQNTSLIDLQSDAFRDETPILPPSGSPALN
uniref:LBH domain-containing protein n=1 Tax=Salmo trutta TaxID=8032 RepID=A0A674E5W4_SALTR